MDKERELEIAKEHCRHLAAEVDRLSAMMVARMLDAIFEADYLADYTVSWNIWRDKHWEVIKEARDRDQAKGCPRQERGG